MTEIAAPQPHRVGAAITAAHTALGEVSDAPVWSMSPEQATRALDDLAAHEARVAALRSRLIVQAQAVEANATMRMPAWLAHRHRISMPEAHRRVRLAIALDAHPLTARALDDGPVNPEQARVILDGVGDLPDDVDPQQKVKAEEHLIGLAADHAPKALKNLARHLLEVVAPEVAEERIAAQLDKEERDAEAANRIQLWQTPDGRGHGKFTLDAFSFACLKKALLAQAAPQHRAAQGPLGERLPRTEELGRAFADYVRRYPASKLPKAGGMNATVVCLIPFDTLMGGLKAAKLDTGEDISPGLSRRVAAEAGIIPAVLGGKSEVLDLGRKRRFHSRAQRIKATIEQGGCIAEGHDCPPAFTQMHHPEQWAKGGGTDGDGWMLCPPAHRMIHDPRFTHERLPNGKVRFHRRV